MTEQEAFEKNAEPYDYELAKAKCGCCTYLSDGTENRYLGWQARGEYEAERVKKLLEASNNAHIKLIMCGERLSQEALALHKAIREYQEGKNETS